MARVLSYLIKLYKDIFYIMTRIDFTMGHINRTLEHIIWVLILNKKQETTCTNQIIIIMVYLINTTCCVIIGKKLFCY